MYKSFRQFTERLLRIPPDPVPPPGDEASTRLFRAAPAYYQYLLLVWALKGLAAIAGCAVGVLAPLMAAYMALKRGHYPELYLFLIPVGVIVIALVGLIFSLAIIRLDFEKRWYVVTDRSLRVREGVALIREMTVTFANIQNLAISQGPIQRLFGIADLRVDTAGGGATNPHKPQAQNLHTAWLRGVNNANEVREVIQDRLRHYKDTGLGDHDEPPAVVPSSTNAVLNALRELDHEASALREAATR